MCSLVFGISLPLCLKVLKSQASPLSARSSKVSRGKLLRLWDPEILKSLNTKVLKAPGRPLGAYSCTAVRRLLPEQPRSSVLGASNSLDTPSVLWACLRASTPCSRVYSTSYTLWNNLDERTWRANSALRAGEKNIDLAAVAIAERAFFGQILKSP